MASFKNYVPAKSTVVRSGKQVEILSEQIVVGDIVVLKYGMRVSADMRVIECSNLYVDNSCLTGESLELERLTDHVEDKALEAKNLMFYGTLVKSGTGRGLVIHVGDHTFMGLIAKVMTDTEVQQTPIAIEIEHFIHIISYIAFFLGISFFVAG
jgi:sodium/potassium-transporting ATPase subunit alpha